MTVDSKWHVHVLGHNSAFIHDEMGQIQGDHLKPDVARQMVEFWNNRTYLQACRIFAEQHRDRTGITRDPRWWDERDAQQRVMDAAVEAYDFEMRARDEAGL